MPHPGPVGAPRSAVYWSVCNPTTGPNAASAAATNIRLRPGHLAGRIIGPVAIEPDDAPLDAPARADHAGVLGDRIVDSVLAAVGDLDDPAAEAAWNGVGGPGPERGLADQGAAGHIRAPSCDYWRWR